MSYVYLVIGGSQKSLVTFFKYNTFFSFDKEKNSCWFEEGKQGILRKLEQKVKRKQS